MTCARVLISRPLLEAIVVPVPLLMRWAGRRAARETSNQVSNRASFSPAGKGVAGGWRKTPLLKFNCFEGTRFVLDNGDVVAYSDESNTFAYAESRMVWSPPFPFWREPCDFWNDPSSREEFRGLFSRISSI